MIFGGVFDPEAVKSKIAEKEAITLAPDVWNDSKKAEKIM